MLLSTKSVCNMVPGQNCHGPGSYYRKVPRIVVITDTALSILTLGLHGLSREEGPWLSIQLLTAPNWFRLSTYLTTGNLTWSDGVAILLPTGWLEVHLLVLASVTRYQYVKKNISWIGCKSSSVWYMWLGMRSSRDCYDAIKRVISFGDRLFHARLFFHS